LLKRLGGLLVAVLSLHPGTFMKRGLDRSVLWKLLFLCAFIAFAETLSQLSTNDASLLWPTALADLCVAGFATYVLMAIVFKK
jgi:hypothetical protein